LALNRTINYFSELLWQRAKFAEQMRRFAAGKPIKNRAKKAAASVLHVEDLVKLMAE